MPEGTYSHAKIASTPPKRAECAVGWIAHYMIGVTFAVGFVGLVGTSWLQRPTLFPALVFGVVTVLAPFFIMQPLMGLGLAASNTARPMQSRLRSVTNHVAFGAGLYLFATLFDNLLRMIG
jgi:uncharacterized membrane protein YagU involved in acid resistance